MFLVTKVMALTPMEAKNQAAKRADNLVAYSGKDMKILMCWLSRLRSRIRSRTHKETRSHAFLVSTRYSLLLITIQRDLLRENQKGSRYIKKFGYTPAAVALNLRMAPGATFLGSKGRGYRK